MLATENSTGRHYVAKKISTFGLSNLELLRSKQESDLLKQLNHPNIVGHKENFLEKGKIIIIMEHCEGGDLSKLIKKNSLSQQYFPESQAAIWFSQLAKALEFIHSHNILHRDIKSSNIFISKEGTLKLGDFGIAKVLEASCDVAHTLVGTPLYMSPELCSNQPYDRKSDIWSMGCVFYEVLALHQPFISQNILVLINKITKDTQEPLSEMYSESIRDLVSSMLIKDVDARISTKELAAHPFFTDLFFNPVQSIENFTVDKDSFLNPMDMCGEPDGVIGNHAGNLEDSQSSEGSAVLISSDSESESEDNLVPQDERSDDENVVIKSSSLSSGRDRIRTMALDGRSEDGVIAKKINEAIRRFGAKEYLEVYDFLKTMRIGETEEDIVRII